MSPEATGDDLNQAGLAAFAAGRFGEAEDLYRRSIATQPGAYGHWHNLGVLLYAIGRLNEARSAFTKALGGGTVFSRHSLALTALRQGDYAAGWPLFEARRDLPTATLTESDLPLPSWKGEPLDGKVIIVFPEQGLGDTLQFSRFVLRLRDRGARVTLACAPTLVRLFESSFDGVSVKPLEGQLDLGDPDYWSSIGSLPHLLKLGAEVGLPMPYLRASAPSSPSAGRLRLGLVTRGNPAHLNDARRSLEEDVAQHLRRLDRFADVISLHPEDTGARDFAQTADLVAGLDLVVTVDSAVGHLAGGMGKAALVLVPGFNTDWRWQEGLDHTPWYPTHQLFHATVGGDWSAALDGVDAEVAARAADKGAGA